MAAAAYTSGTHVRSASWPQDTQPHTKIIRNHLFLLTQTLDSSSSCWKLGILNNLYEVVNEILRFQTTTSHEAFKDLEDVSDGFLKTLDICRITRDVLMEVKEQVRELESNLRRRIKRGEDQEQLEIEAYVWKRRELSKRVFKDLKKTEESKKKKKRRDCGEESLMKQVEEKSFEVMVCLLLDVVRDQRRRSGGAGRRLVWKMLFQWRNQEEEEEEEERYEMSLKKLQETEEEIEETEKELESVYKKMIKIRVFLLNMLTF